MEVLRLATRLRPLSAVRRCGYATSTAWDDALIQRSAVPSMHFQASLPRMPVPTLPETLHRYLASLDPLCGEGEAEQARRLCEEFKNGEGKALQAQLKAYDKAHKHSSYISQAWFDMYLEGRDPLPANSNPYISWPNDPDPAKSAQDVRAAVLIRSSLRFFKSLKANAIKPDLYHLDPKKTDNDTFLLRSKWVPSPLRFIYAYLNGVFPLDMSQYGRLFQSTRIPRQAKDELFTDGGARHVVVLRRNRLYTFDVLSREGAIATTEAILAQVRGILADGRPPEAQPLGALTTDNRDTWAEARRQLESDPTNAKHLRALDSALFVVALDDSTPGESEETIAQLNRQLLVGDGRNRWFDKSFSVMVLPDGLAGVNFEHAWGDGISVLRYITEVHGDAMAAPVPRPTSAVAPKELKFNLVPEVRAAIAKAEKRFDEDTGRLGFKIGLCDAPLGRDALKRHGVGADGLCQLSFQLAHYRLHGRTAATYESCSTAAFRHGRTETIRPNTRETLAAARALLDPGTGREERLARIHAAAKKHNELTKNAAMGKGFDRHLFMLKHLAGQRGGALPSLFTSGGLYDRMNHIILSTSTLQSPAIQYGGFGPVSHNGWGVGYSLLDECLGVSISNYNDQSEQMFDAISESWKDIYCALENKQGAVRKHGLTAMNRKQSPTRDSLVDQGNIELTTTA